MRKIVTRMGAFMLLMMSSAAYAQMTGSYTIPGSFASLAAAISSLNAVGVGTGGATLNIAAAYTETAPAGGYVLTATGTASNPIVFQRSGAGANPLITAFTGTCTSATALQDGVVSLVGSDYVTFNGIDIMDPNTTNPATMEYGYGFFANNANDGSQYNTIKNCTVTLNRVNNAASTSPATPGSRGINVVGSTYTTQTILLAIASATGANSYNKFYNNLVQNCNIGVAIYGNSTAANYDTNNDIGGTSAATSNTIVNFGGGGTYTAYGVTANYQQNINVSYNIINNNNGAGVNHPSGIYGINFGTATSVNVSVLSNTLTISNGIASGTSYVIANASGSTPATNTVQISNNLIANCNNTIVTSGVFLGIYNAGAPATMIMSNNTFSNNIVGGQTVGAFYGIYNAAAPTNLQINNNTFTNTSTQATSGIIYMIYQASSPTGSISIQNNDISWTHNGPSGHTGAFYGIYNISSGTTATLNVSGNDFSNITHSVVTASENLYFINLAGTQSQRFVNSNTFTNLNLNHAYYEYLITNSGTVTNTLTVNNNSIVGTYSRGNGNSFYTYCVYNNGQFSGATGLKEIANNNFSNITFGNPGQGYFYGIFDNNGGCTTAPYGRLYIHNNLISNINIATSSNYQFFGVYTNYYIGSDGTTGSSVNTNTITNINYQGIIYGYYMAPSISDPNRSTEMYDNEMSNAVGTYSVFGMYLVPASNTANAHLKVYRNKIAGLVCNTANAPVYGINANSGAYADIYNNIIGQLYSNYSSGTVPSVAGLNITGYTNLWYNTVYLDANNSAGAGTLIVTAANYATAAAYINTTYNVDMRNNILINNSVSKGTGKTISHWRSTLAPATYSNSSNNNLYYAGVPSASNVIYYDGSLSFQTIAPYKILFSPRDSSSVVEAATPFISTTPTATNFLHIDASQVTLARAGATTITAITSDFDTDVRQGNAGYMGGASAPDIGADEFNLCVPPSPPLSTSALSDYVLCSANGEIKSLSATGTGTISWYSSAAGGTAIATGNNFTTPSLTGNTVFYAAATTSCSSNRLAFNIVMMPKPTVSILTQTNTVCEGSSISLIATGNAATYTWTQGGTIGNAISITPTATAIYTVEAAAPYGCVNTATQQIVVNAMPVIIASTTKSIVCKGEPVTLKSTGAQTYTWTSNTLLANGDNVQTMPGATTVFTVTGTDANGCTGTATVQARVNACAGINEAKGNSLQLSVYPNPTNGAFTVELNNGLDKALELFDLTGRMVMSNNTSDNNININISQLPNGVYYLKVRSNNAVEVVKVVKQ